MWTRRSCRACMRALISRRPWMRELLWVPQWPTLWRITGRTLPPPECSRILPSCSPSPRFPNTRETSLLSILTFDLMYCNDTLQPTLIQWSGRFLGTTSVEILVFASPTGYMLTSILRFFYINLRYIPSIHLKWSVDHSPEVLNLNRLFLNSTASFVTNCRFSPISAPIMNLHDFPFEIWILVWCDQHEYVNGRLLYIKPRVKLSLPLARVTV